MSDVGKHVPELPPDDRLLLDALVDAGFDVDRLELHDDDTDRARALTRLLELLEDYPVEDAEPTLIDATLARIDQFEERRTRRLRFAETAESGGGRRLRLPDFVTVAAVLLIGASVALPVLNMVRQRSIDQGCEDKLRYLASAFSYYANDNGDAMPVAQAGLHQAWSPFFSNVLNLQPLIEQGYCDHGHFDCPGHESGIGDSYSYQWPPEGSILRWNTGPTTVVLSDRNPAIEAARRGEIAAPMSNSPNHGGRGQAALRTDGGTMWLDKPVVGRGDNIWLPEGVEELIDGLKPRSFGDVFLAQ